MEGKTQNQREHIEWHIARQVVDRALESGKAIWVYRSVLEKIEVYARRLGVQLIKVNPTYTSIIGKLKYAPIYNIDKDEAWAWV